MTTKDRDTHSDPQPHPQAAPGPFHAVTPAARPAAAAPVGPVMHGKLGRDAVKKLADDLKKVAADNNFEVGPITDFGLGLQVFDPQSGAIVVAARPHMRDPAPSGARLHGDGQAGGLMTVEQVVAEVVGARLAMIQHARAMA